MTISRVSTALHPVIAWLRGGCDPQAAAKELDAISRRFHHEQEAAEERKSKPIDENMAKELVIRAWSDIASPEFMAQSWRDQPGAYLRLIRSVETWHGIEGAK